MIFTIFAVFFPFVVFAVFIWTLVNQPANLYSPWQFSSEREMEVFRALGRQARTSSHVFGQAAVETVAAFSGGGQESSRVIEKFESLVEGSSIVVERAALVPGAKPVQIPVRDDTTAGELLDSVYFELAPVVKPFTYGSSWLLVDEHGAVFTDIGTTWARQQGFPRDERPLRDAGILPASTLHVVRAPP